MKILLLGKHGQLGWELQRTLGTLGEIIALDMPEIDFSQPDSIPDLMQDIHPQVIVNATAYTAVDRAESEPKLAMTINGIAPGILASQAAQINAALIHYSTDYVFDGMKGTPYQESDLPNPLNFYGESKLRGERAIQQIDVAYLILRTSWVYSLRGESFVNKVLKWSRKQDTLRIVSDQIANPTWARMLAEATSQLIAKAGDDIQAWIYNKRGLYHLAGSGYASRLEWAKAILKNDPLKDKRLSQNVIPAKTIDFPTPAQRPLFSALNCDLFKETFNLCLPPWEKALELAMTNNHKSTEF
jgi:dTDP-4-dehydrorhamnose reductase